MHGSLPDARARHWKKHLPRALEVAVSGDTCSEAEAASRVNSRLNLDSVSEYRLNDIHLAAIGQRYCHINTPDCIDCPVALFCDSYRAVEAKRATSPIPFIDLFCGCGGLSTGLEAAGMTPVLANDIDQAASATYAFNRPGLSPSQIRTGSVSELEISQAFHALAVVGGPPCQGFSNANRQRLSDDPRNYLYRDFLRTLQSSGAPFGLMENVPLMQKALPALSRDFEEIGYRIQTYRLEASDLGVPQNRERLFVLALRTDDALSFYPIADYFGQQLTSEITDRSGIHTLADAISDLPRLSAKTIANKTDYECEEFGFTISHHPGVHAGWAKKVNKHLRLPFLLNHRSKYNNSRDIEIYGRLTPGEDSTAASIQDILPYHRRADIFKDKFYKLDFRQRSKTITAHMYYDCHMYIHPDQARGLTPREAARIQGFPDNYMFLGYPNEWYRQIGNAVSPTVAHAVGAALVSTIKYAGLA